MFKGMQGMQGLVQKAQKMQQQMQEVQEKLAQTEMTGTSGAGMVTVSMNGKFEVKKITIDPKIVDPSDIDMLEDLIVAAINDAKAKIDTHSASEMAKITEGFPMPAGMKLPF